MATERPAARRGSTCVRGRAPVIPPTGRESGPWRTSGGALRSRPLFLPHVCSSRRSAGREHSTTTCPGPPGPCPGGAHAQGVHFKHALPARRGPPRTQTRAGGGGLFEVAARHQSARVPSLVVPPGSSRAPPPRASLLSPPARAHSALALGGLIRRPGSLSLSSWGRSSPTSSSPLPVGGDAPIVRPSFALHPPPVRPRFRAPGDTPTPLTALPGGRGGALSI